MAQSLGKGDHGVNKRCIDQTLSQMAMLHEQIAEINKNAKDRLIQMQRRQILLLQEAAAKLPPTRADSQPRPKDQKPKQRDKTSKK